MKKFAGADWLGKILEERGIKLSRLGSDVADMLGQAFCGIYHLNNSELFNKRTAWASERHIEIVLRRDLSTYDDSTLTILVLEAHNRGVRMCIEGAANDYLRLRFLPYYRDGEQRYKHRTIDDAIESVRIEANAQ